ncbi:aspartate-semialdehyde dehydrogenase, partial [Acidaminococcus fermentans]
PLIVPEVNPQDITKHHGIIANPNCSTIIMVMALKPIYDLARIKRIIVSTYQAASGAGKDGLDELENQIKQAARGEEMTARIFPSASAEKHFPLALNLVPQIDIFLDNLYTKEEMKMVNETKKIFSDPEMRITATTVRVPVYRSHSESVNVELEHDVELEDIRKALAGFPGVVLQDDPSRQIYPMPLYTSGKNDVYVGRLRRDESAANSFNFWCVGDQIRKGAALNTLQIAETMVKNGWL